MSFEVNTVVSEPKSISVLSERMLVSEIANEVHMKKYGTVREKPFKLSEIAIDETLPPSTMVRNLKINSLFVEWVYYHKKDDNGNFYLAKRLNKNMNHVEVLGMTGVSAKRSLDSIFLPETSVMANAYAPTEQNTNLKVMDLLKNKQVLFEIVPDLLNGLPYNPDKVRNIDRTVVIITPTGNYVIGLESDDYHKSDYEPIFANGGLDKLRYYIYRSHLTRGLWNKIFQGTDYEEKSFDGWAVPAIQCQLLYGRTINVLGDATQVDELITRPTRRKHYLTDAPRDYSYRGGAGHFFHEHYKFDSPLVVLWMEDLNATNKTHNPHNESLPTLDWYTDFENAIGHMAMSAPMWPDLSQLLKLKFEEISVLCHDQKYSPIENIRAGERLSEEPLLPPDEEDFMFDPDTEFV